MAVVEVVDTSEALKLVGALLSPPLVTSPYTSNSKRLYPYSVFLDVASIRIKRPTPDSVKLSVSPLPEEVEYTDVQLLLSSET